MTASSTHTTATKLADFLLVRSSQRGYSFVGADLANADAFPAISQRLAPTDMCQPADGSYLVKDRGIRLKVGARSSSRSNCISNHGARRAMFARRAPSRDVPYFPVLVEVMPGHL
jgi:hypothetical protein